MGPETLKAYMEMLKAITKIAWPENPERLAPTTEEVMRLGAEQMADGQSPLDGQLHKVATDEDLDAYQGSQDMTSEE